jgi:hypothetical protein
VRPISDKTEAGRQEIRKELCLVEPNPEAAVQDHAFDVCLVNAAGLEGGLNTSKTSKLKRQHSMPLGAVSLVRAKAGVSGRADRPKGREFPDCYW